LGITTPVETGHALGLCSKAWLVATSKPADESSLSQAQLHAVLSGVERTKSERSVPRVL
jgi:hypothetical protein